MSDTFRFQEQSRREALPQSPDSEEDQHQEAEGSDRNLDLSVEADEEEQMPLSDVPGSNQCKRIVHVVSS